MKYIPNRSKTEAIQRAGEEERNSNNRKEGDD